MGELPEGQAEVGFVDGVAGSATQEYDYDASGNMTSDANKGISSITYDPVLNLLTEVVITGKGTIKYTYDASGTKLRQEVLPSDGSPTKTTDYVAGFHYTDGTLDFIQHEEGRLMIKDGLAYHYDLKDHLGNARVTFSNIPVTTTAQATMEASAAPVEEAVFEGVAESRQTLAFHNTTDASSSEPQPNKVATLQPGQQGPTKSVQVHAGDTVRLKVNARYETVPSQVQGMEGVATEIAGAVSRSAAGLENAGAITGTNGLAAGSALTTGKEQEVPQAYLNYLLYDENYQLVDQGFQQVSQAAAVGKANPGAAPEELALEVPIQEEGFLYTYLSNGPSASSSLVYFDDFTVEQRSYIVAVHDYYPFGADFDQQSMVGVANKYRYQGKELQAELGLDLYDFHARQYDPLLGRMTSIDPMAASWDGMSPYVGMANNPVSYVDPDGRNPIIIGMMIGGTAGFGIGYASGLRGNELLASTLGGMALGAGIGFGVNGGFGGFGQGLGGVLANAPGAAANLAQRVFSGVGPTLGADVGLRATQSSFDVGPLYMVGVEDQFGRILEDYGDAYQPSRYAGMNIMQYHQAKVGDAFWDHPVNQGVREAASWMAPTGKVLGVAGKLIGKMGSKVAPKLLIQGARALHKHHILPQKYRYWFKNRGISNIDDYTIRISQPTHSRGVHGRGLGKMPGRWNQHWANFIKNNPNATPSEIFHYAEGLMQRYGLEHLRYVPY